ncbi:polyisoprenoid diphosphate/phosphate phosphohydrolase PLPP6-like [Panonychus citri]|uniref:polyisoprenoid diphosphate/phosphate phosphohydrolase PLPP6-like n=1 Tax=Panonychus citri TaxID=50023 RepID=UPI002306E27C|nr:polyisoprenoid diphosphate/phosphate phosphohydrolase PLPP6-like [Panonychus citri]
MERLKSIDISLSYRMFKLWPKGQNCRFILSALEWSCHGIPWFVGVIIAIYIWPNSKLLAQLLAGLLLDLITIAVTKALTRRRRPSYANQEDQMIVASVDKHSMPSGHASRAIYVALLLNSDSFSSLLVWIWAGSVCLSRIFLGRHHILDVVVGFLCAYIIFTLQFSFGGFLNKIVVWILLHQFSNTNDLSTAESIGPTVD